MQCCLKARLTSSVCSSDLLGVHEVVHSESEISVFSNPHWQAQELVITPWRDWINTLLVTGLVEKSMGNWQLNCWSFAVSRGSFILLHNSGVSVSWSPAIKSNYLRIITSVFSKWLCSVTQANDNKDIDLSKGIDKTVTQRAYVQVEFLKDFSEWSEEKWTTFLI